MVDNMKNIQRKIRWPMLLFEADAWCFSLTFLWFTFAFCMMFLLIWFSVLLSFSYINSLYFYVWNNPFVKWHGIDSEAWFYVDSLLIYWISTKHSSFGLCIDFFNLRFQGVSFVWWLFWSSTETNKSRLLAEVWVRIPTVETCFQPLSGSYRLLW